MRMVVAAFVCGALAMALAGCALPSSYSQTQHGHVMLGGERADVVCTEQPSQMTVTIIARQKKSHPIDWSKIQIQLGCLPTNFPGGFSSDMRLVETNVLRRRRASATYAFRAETPIINDVAEVLIMNEGNELWSFEMPLSREEILERFRLRASCDELRQLGALRRSKNPDDQERALETVLFKLTWYELERIGIEASPSRIVCTSDSKGRVYPNEMQTWHWDWWGLASGSFLFGDAKTAQVDEALERAGIGPVCIGGMGVDWRVQNGDFLRARRILIALKINGLYVADLPEFHF